ncbi:MAG: amidase, partial [Solirubrobacteraceae bacterium]
VLNAIAGYDPADVTTVRTPVADYTSALGEGVRGLRIGVPRAYFFAHLEDEVASAVEAAISELRRLGAELHDVEIPGVDQGVGALFGLVLAEAKEIHAHALRTRLADFGPDVRELLSSPMPDAMSLMQALRARDALCVSFRQALESVDLLLTPSTPIVAARIGAESIRYGGREESVLGAMIRCTAPFNATGLPALSLPCGFTCAGLPVGLQLVGRAFDEVTVLRAGHAYERATGWYELKPALG